MSDSPSIMFYTCILSVPHHSSFYVPSMYVAMTHSFVLILCHNYSLSCPENHGEHIGSGTQYKNVSTRLNCCDMFVQALKIPWCPQYWCYTHAHYPPTNSAILGSNHWKSGSFWASLFRQADNIEGQSKSRKATLCCDDLCSRTLRLHSKRPKEA